MKEGLPDIYVIKPVQKNKKVTQPLNYSGIKGSHGFWNCE